MRRSGRVNQLTAAQVPIRPLLFAFPLCHQVLLGLATRPARTSYPQVVLQAALDQSLPFFPPVRGAVSLAPPAR